MKKIIVAVDGSECGMTAARAAVSVGRLYGALIMAIYVAETGRVQQLSKLLAVSGMRELVLEMMRKSGEEATKAVENIAIQSGLQCERMIVEGVPSAELLRRSKELNADLLVLGRTGKEGFGRFLLGDTAEKVLEHSTVPVLVVPAKCSFA
jgi:nucleotide-binding universal stress UspA family protein